MSITTTSNLSGNVGADVSNYTEIDFSNLNNVPYPKTIGVSITGTGKCRMSINNATPNATTDTVIEANTGMNYFFQPGGYSNVKLYADNGETQTYSISKNQNELS